MTLLAVVLGAYAAALAMPPVVEARVGALMGAQSGNARKRISSWVRGHLARRAWGAAGRRRQARERQCRIRASIVEDSVQRGRIRARRVVKPWQCLVEAIHVDATTTRVGVERNRGVRGQCIVGSQLQQVGGRSPAERHGSPCVSGG